MKVNSRKYKGIEYIELNDLPKEQRDRFFESAHEEFLIKILIDKRIVGNCIQYKDYLNWFDTIYKASASPAPIDRKVLETPSINIAFGKA